MKIGEKIKKIRELRNFTQDYMATQLEMTQAGYSRIEREEVDIPFSRLEQIAKALKMSLIELFSVDDTKFFGSQNNNNATNITNGFIISNETYIQELKNSYDGRIIDLQKEIDFLREMMRKMSN